METDKEYRDHDVYVGKSTSISDDLDGVRIELNRAHLRGRIVGLAIFVFFLVSMFRFGTMGAILGILISVGVVPQIIRKAIEEFREFPIFVADDRDVNVEKTISRVIYRDDIEAVELCRNWGQRQDDKKRIQIYLHLKTQAEAVFVHQTMAEKSELKAMSELAEDLAARWSVPLIRRIHYVPRIVHPGSHE